MLCGALCLGIYIHTHTNIGIVVAAAKISVDLKFNHVSWALNTGGIVHAEYQGSQVVCGTECTRYIRVYAEEFKLCSCLLRTLS